MNITTTLIIVSSFPATAVSDEDTYQAARELQEEGKIVPLAQIIQQAQQQHPGRVIEVALKRKADGYLYEVELVGEDGQVWEMLFDARNGKPIARNTKP